MTDWREQVAELEGRRLIETASHIDEETLQEWLGQAGEYESVSLTFREHYQCGRGKYRAVDGWESKTDVRSQMLYFRRKRR